MADIASTNNINPSLADAPDAGAVAIIGDGTDRGDIKDKPENTIDTKLFKEQAIKDEQAAKFLEAIGLSAYDKENLLKEHPELALLVATYDTVTHGYPPSRNSAFALNIAKDIQDGEIELQPPTANGQHSNDYQKHLSDRMEVIIKNLTLQQQQQIQQNQALTQGQPSAGQQQARADYGLAQAPAVAGSQVQTTKEKRSEVDAVYMPIERRAKFLQAIEHPEHAREIIANDKDVQVALAFYKSMEIGTKKADGLTDVHEKAMLNHLKDNLGNMLAKDDRASIQNLSQHVENKLNPIQEQERVATV